MQETATTGNLTMEKEQEKACESLQKERTEHSVIAVNARPKCRQFTRDGGAFGLGRGPVSSDKKERTGYEDRDSLVARRRTETEQGNTFRIKQKACEDDVSKENGQSEAYR